MHVLLHVELETVTTELLTNSAIRLPCVINMQNDISYTESVRGTEKFRFTKLDRTRITTVVNIIYRCTDRATKPLTKCVLSRSLLRTHKTTEKKKICWIRTNGRPKEQLLYSLGSSRGEKLTNSRRVPYVQTNDTIFERYILFVTLNRKFSLRRKSRVLTAGTFRTTVTHTYICYTSYITINTRKDVALRTNSSNRSNLSIRLLVTWTARVWYHYKVRACAQDLERKVRFPCQRWMAADGRCVARKVKNCAGRKKLCKTKTRSRRAQ